MRACRPATCSTSRRTAPARAPAIRSSSARSAPCSARAGRRTAAAVVGSVKTNIGHTEGAAGVAGLIKAALALDHGVVPPSLHFDEPNPAIPWAELPRADAAPDSVAGSRTAAFAGVSAFGIAGTNAHVVLAGVAARGREPRATASARPAMLAAVGAESTTALRSAGARRSRVLAGRRRRAFADRLLYGGRTAHPPRAPSVSGRAGRDAMRSNILQAFASRARRGQVSRRAGPCDAAPARSRSCSRGRARSGSAWAGSCSRPKPVFRDALERVRRGGARVDRLVGARRAARRRSDRSNLSRIDVVQPTLFAIQVALAALWRSWGVEPAAVVGHSMGEVAAAHVAGALSLERRGARSSAGAARCCGAPAARARWPWSSCRSPRRRRRCAGYEDRLSVAVSNSSRSTVLSGDPAALDECLAGLEARGVFCRKVKVDVASHSPQMDPLRDELLAALRRDFASRCVARVLLDGRGTRRSTAPSSRPSTGSRNLREPVLFSKAVRSLVEDGVRHVHRDESRIRCWSAAVQEVAGEAGRECPLARLRVGGTRTSRSSSAPRSARCTALGVHRRLAVVVLAPSAASSPLPTYPWQRDRFWYDAPDNETTARRRPVGDLLGEALSTAQQPGTRHWQFDLSLSSLPFIADHQVRSAVVVPAALFLELLVEAARRALAADAVDVTEFNVGAALMLSGQETRTVQVALTAEGSRAGRVVIVSRAAAGRGRTAGPSTQAVASKPAAPLRKRPSSSGLRRRRRGRPLHTTRRWPGGGSSTVTPFESSITGGAATAASASR